MHLNPVAPFRQSMKKIVAIGSLLLLPAVAFYWAMVFYPLNHPFWLGRHIDPAYLYLTSILDVATFQKAGHYEHPGATLQLLGGFVVNILYLGVDKAQMIESVLKKPEIFLTLLANINGLLNGFLLVLSGFLGHRLLGSYTKTLLLQCGVLLSHYPTEMASTMYIENMLMTGAFLFNIVAVCALSEWYRFEKYIKNYENWFALVIGFLMATKLIMLFLLAVPLFIFPLWKQKIATILKSTVIFIVLTLPLASQYSRMVLWFGKLFLGSGQYGSGQNTIVGLGSMRTGMEELWLWAGSYTILVGVSFVVLLAVVLVGLKEKVFEKKLFIGLNVAHLVFIIMLLKNVDPRYISPYFILIPINFILIYELFKDKFKHKFVLRLLISSLFIVLIAREIPYFLEREKYLTTMKAQSLHIYKTIENIKKTPNTAVLPYYRSSHPLYALSFGNLKSEGHYTSALKKIYGEVYFYNVFHQYFTDWGKVQYISEPRNILGITTINFIKVRFEHLNINQLQSQYPSTNFYLNGTPFDQDNKENMPPNATLQPVLIQEDEAIYRIKPNATPQTDSNPLN